MLKMHLIDQNTLTFYEHNQLLLQLLIRQKETLMCQHLQEVRTYATKSQRRSEIR